MNNCTLWLMQRQHDNKYLGLYQALNVPSQYLIKLHSADANSSSETHGAEAEPVMIAVAIQQGRLAAATMMIGSDETRVKGGPKRERGPAGGSETEPS